MQLERRWQLRTPGGELRALKHAAGDHHVARAPRSVVRFDVERAVVARLYRLDRDTFMHTRAQASDVSFEEADDFVARHETVGIRTVVMLSREPCHPVRRQEGERVPPLAAPALNGS